MANKRFDLSNGGIRTSKISNNPKAAPGGVENREPVKAADTRQRAVSDSTEEVSMSVSSVCEEAGERFAFVRFEDRQRYCEFRFPEVALKVNDGFSEEELVQLKFFVKNNIPQLKKLAASVDPFHAIKNG